jgi:protein-tyrosine phosphatase
MIDIHCHILWDIDDGPADFDGSMAMARLAAAAGTRQLVATPHIHDAQQSPEIIAEKVAHLNQALQAEGVDLEILCGGDNLYNLGAENLARFSINGTHYTLVEFPHTHLPAYAGDAIFEALHHGLVPIITHPERNPSIVKDPKLIFEMVESGALVQLTAESLTGGFGPAAKACSRYLLKKKMVHFLASDGHSAKHRPPILSAGVKAAAKIVGKDAARKLVFDNPGKIVRGHDLKI